MTAVFKQGSNGRAELGRWATLLLLLFLSALGGGLLGALMVPRFYAKPLPPGTAPPPLPLAHPPHMAGEPSPVVAVAKQVGPAVVGVTALTGSNLLNRESVRQGSGIIFDGANGYIVTNNHVIAGASRITVSLDRDQVLPAEVVGRDVRSDLAVLRVRAGNLPTARLGDSSSLQVGETVVAIGNPLGREFARSVTVGVISALNREITVGGQDGRQITLRVLQTDAPINPGNSGGALVNMRGEVIGINSVKIATTGVEGMGFAIPINDARPILEQLIRQGYVSRPFLGVYNLKEITPEMAEWYNIPAGLFVGGVLPDSPASRAGIKVEDIITKIDGQQVLTYGDLDRALVHKKPGEQVALTLYRRAKGELTVTAILGELSRE
ncbi:MAG: trypsin-like peptidase domain-containing protein [Thermanaeromonas sp.]|uniref:S1C family serine protease n=1 Tax=Thermanaeromonas sp. TaxID=2003697 RepID=UPI00243D5D0F|nr:trypsin-like peptidase domain-containing protein [Thermanaeromonas sp.]MCG0277377.1 trypsin-like peptidase domain-containing protein [Thermanaeromonas sp.]